MPDLKLTILMLLSSLLLAGCVSQRYAGVSITSTAPMRITKVMINGDAVVLCRVTP
ncbi:hypothetical protein JEQ07_18665 [Serratia proteamaculans]|uniref:Lipoprotein n=1 Tax=Serratia proteamaculans TaxID=28151 RepID=A0ABS0TVK8_SERPR|nr:hypothetical protein [Serratia proteamaculans]MBI6182402.1 hypothetical protein [Serratia proteamaculans]